MGDAKKTTLADTQAAFKAGAASALKTLLSTPTFGRGAAGLPPGVRIETNAAQSTRFPLPLTIGAAVIGALGVIAAVKGHRIIGGALVVVAVGGLGAAAAAPELQGALSKLQGASGGNA